MMILVVISSDVDCIVCAERRVYSSLYEEHFSRLWQLFLSRLSGGVSVPEMIGNLVQFLWKIVIFHGVRRGRFIQN